MNPETKLTIVATNVASVQPLARMEIFELTVDGSTYKMVLPNAAVDYIQRKLATERVPYELEMLRDMQSRLSSGDLVLDAGANIGNHSLYLASIVGCRVAAFEPNKELSNALLTSVKLNDLGDHVTVSSHALGKINDTGHFAKEIPDNLGSQSIELGDGPIKIKPLDSIRFAGVVKAIKIDVEGMELDVLKGGSRLIDKDRPILYVECQTEEIFRTISSWLTKKNYSYWDTFNATPTHLFLPNEQVTVDQRLARLQLKTEQNEYQLAQKIIAVRQKLDDANQKYREATEQVSTLKQRVDQQESARVATVKELAESQTQLTEAKTRLQEERTALQQKIERLSEQGQSSSEAAHEAEKQLIDLQAKFEANQERLHETNNKYRFATDQASILKQRLENVEHARKIAENFSQDTATQLEQANLKYRKITAEDIPNLKNKLEDSYAIKRELQHVIEQMKLEAKKGRQELTEVNAKMQKLQQQKMAVDQQVVKTRASLSFQLGYLLIHNVKSVRGIFGLPSALWAWRKEWLKRRAQQNQRQKALEIVVPARAVKVEAKEKSVSPERQQLIATQSSPVLADHAPPTLITAAGPVKELRQLKVACIMDEFTFGSYRHECDTQQLTPDHWKAELEAFQPELLFIESAWRGKDELWGNKVGHTSKELQGIVAWCRAMNIPTVFWNKEDPVHFETFLTTAKLFDHVFTTDIDCIHRYKAALGHGRVYLLPFACQPANNNPIETYDRKDAFCFAGAYYVKYPERTKDLGNFVEALPAFRPLEIYDRNFGKNDPNYQFPSEYQPYIVGTLPFDQIDKAYKGYRYAINLNSIKQSQTMFARRVFELLASNTITVSNFSRGVRLLFGDLVITTDSGSEMVDHLNQVASDETHSRKLRLAALRKVMEEHTYVQRMAYVVSKVTGQAQQNTLPHITVVALAASQPELDSILHHYQQQSYAYSKLLIVVPDYLKPSSPAPELRIRILNAAEISGQTLRGFVSNDQWVASMHAADYYGPNYLLDIALATRYSGADVIGKAAHFTWLDGAPALQQTDAAYRPANRLLARSAAMRLQTVADMPLAEWLSGLASRSLATDYGLAIDEFNYCRNGAEPAIRNLVSASVDDLRGLNTGIGIDELLKRAERIAPAPTGHDESPVFTGKQLATDFGKAPSTAIKLGIEYDHWRIDSTLPDGKHEYLYATTDHSLKTLGVDNQFRFYLDISPGLNIQLVIVFLDAQKQKISHIIKHPNRNQEADIPPGTASIRFGLRFYAGGSAEIKGLVLGHRNLQPAEMIGQGEHLVLTNHYPSYEDLYRNGFVHSRVRAYREHGVRCDVFRLRPEEAVSYHEFEDVDVTSGSQEVLHKMLCSGQYKSVLVHFLDPAMWEVLQHHADRIKIVVWVHGAEIQPWHRRDFNNQTEDQRSVAKMKSDKRMTFWRELLQAIPANLKLVFVSRSFAEDVMEDLGFRIPENHYAIIHNPINTELFSYQEKPIAQRKKVLSIRPYASKIYANDLSVKAIQLLSSKPYFYDLEFRLIGDGLLFVETLAPLRKFRNVYIEQRFLKQDEIATLHKEYGIFLCPSRMDSQGVSRDEAMSSGLVPVTNAVAAIPEFADADCGVLAKSEDAQGLADGIAYLYENPQQYSQRSSNAAKRVRTQSAQEKIITLELNMFNAENLLTTLILAKEK
jgi:FkbM family methyltransferase